MHRPLLPISASGAAYAFLAYYFYTTPPISIPLALVVLEPGSFLLRGETTNVLVGTDWELYAAAAAAVGAVLPWQVVGVAPVEKCTRQASEGVAEAEKMGLAETNVVNACGTGEDLDGWGKALGVKGALAAAGAAAGAYATAWW